MKQVAPRKRTRRLCRDLWLYVVAPRLSVIDLAQLAGVSRRLGVWFSNHLRVVKWREYSPKNPRGGGVSDWDHMYNAGLEGDRPLVDLFMLKYCNTSNIITTLEGLFCGAAEGGHRDLVDMILSTRPNWWIQGLTRAVIGGHQDLVEFFVTNIEIAATALDSSPLTSSVRRYLQTIWQQAFGCAVIRGHRALVDLFISKGARNFPWALKEAAREGHRELVDFFIDIHDNFTIDELEVALVSAAKGGHQDLVKLFISKGAKDVSKMQW